MASAARLRPDSAARPERPREEDEIRKGRHRGQLRTHGCLSTSTTLFFILIASELGHILCSFYLYSVHNVCLIHRRAISIRRSFIVDVKAQGHMFSLPSGSRLRIRTRPIV